MPIKRPAKPSPLSAARLCLLSGFLLAALCWSNPAAAQNGKGRPPRDTTGGTVTAQVCNPAIGCTAGDRPTVWFKQAYSGVIHSGAAITDTVHWCDDGGLNQGSRLVKQNATALTTSYNGSAYDGCWQHATSGFTFTPVLGTNTIYASINDNFGQNGSNQFTFNYDSLQVWVTPDGAAKAKPTVTPVADTFTVQNFTGGTLTYTLSLTCSNAASLNCSAASSVTVNGNSSSTVIVSYRTRGWNSVDTVTLRATSPDGHQTDAGSVIETASQYAASASFAANVEDNQNLALCVNDCFTTVLSHSTASYRSLGVDRRVTLMYHGDRTAVRPYVLADVSVPNGVTAPTEVRLQATVNGTAQTFVNGDGTLHFSTTGWQSGKTYRVAGQLDLSSLPTKMYSLQLTATAIYSDHSETFTSPSSLKMMVVNQRTSSTILPTVGWTIDGIQQLYAQTDGTILIVEGDGSGVYFSCSWYTDPCAGPTGDYSKLTSTGSGSSLRYTRAYPDSSKLVFDNVGHMIQSLDRWGNTSNITYDGSGRISTIGDPILPSYFQFSYGSGFFSIGLPRPNGGTPADTRQTTIPYDGSGHLTAFTDADGNTTQFTYDGSGRLSTMCNRLGDTTLYYYDASSWKLDSVAAPAIAIDGQPQPQRPVGRMRSWQRVGVPTTSTISTFAVAPLIDTIYALSIGAISDTTKFTADKWGQPLTLIDPLGDTTRILRTGTFATAVTNPLGQTDTYTYTNAFLTSTTPYGQPSTSISYDAWGMPSQISGGNAPTVTRAFNATARTLTTIVGGTYVSTDSLDSRGRIFASIDPSGHTSRYHYDATFGIIDSTLAAAGQWTRIVLDGYGRDSVVTALGRLQSVQHIYDRLGRDSLVYDGVNSQPIRYTYNALFLTTVRDQQGQVYKRDLNALGWPTVIYDPADTTSWMRKTTYRYDVGGRVTSYQNRRGSWITQQWDKLARVTSRRDTTGTADSLWYSPDGRALVASNAISVDTIQIGDRGADTVRTHIAGQWFRRVHTATGGTTADTTRLTTSLGSGWVQDRIYFWSQNRGTLDSVRVGASRYSLGYTNELLPDTLGYPGSLLRIDSLTTTHQIYARHYSAAAVDTAFRRGYAYDSLGRITTESEPSHTPGSTILRSYGYTGTGALQWYKGTLISSAFSCAGGYGCGYTGGTVTNTWMSYGHGYDAVKNLMSQVDSLGGNALTSGSFNAGNRLASWGGDSYTYDLDGNRGTHGSTRYTWSGTGKLLKVTNGSSTVEYAYNALGQLVRRKTNGVVDRHFVWDNNQLFLLLDGSGNRIAEYAYLSGDEPLSFSTGAAFTYLTYYYNTDLRGNVVGVSNGVNANREANYGPWGNAENQSGFGLDTTRLGWKSHMWEGGITQLYYVRNRWYDPASRSFISEDPIGIAGGINTYAYAGNDPVNESDPLGLNKDMDTRCQAVDWGFATYYENSGCGGGGGTSILDIWAMIHASGPAVTPPGPVPEIPVPHGGGGGAPIKPGKGGGSLEPLIAKFWTDTKDLYGCPPPRKNKDGEEVLHVGVSGQMVYATVPGGKVNFIHSRFDYNFFERKKLKTTPSGDIVKAWYVGEVTVTAIDGTPHEKENDHTYRIEGTVECKEPKGNFTSPVVNWGFHP